MRFAYFVVLVSLVAGVNSVAASKQNSNDTNESRGLDLGEVAIDINQWETGELSLVEQWTIDYADESQPVLGRITAAESRSDGTVLLLDEQQGRVFEFGPDGSFRRTLGGEGDGPGETRGAYNVCALPDGRTAIVEGAPPMVMRPNANQVILLDRAGQPEEQFSIYDHNRDGVIPILRGARFANELFLVGVYTAQISPTDFVQTNRLMLISADGDRVATLAERSHTESMTTTVAREVDAFNPFQYYRFDISTGGRIAYLPERDKYSIIIAEWPEKRGVSIWASLSGRERTESDLEANSKQSGYENTPVRWEACPRDPVIDQLRFAPNGDLWAYRNARGTFDDRHDFFIVDVYSKSNEFSRQLLLKAPGDREADRLFPLRDGRYIIVRNVYGPEQGGGHADASVSLLVDADQIGTR